MSEPKRIQRYENDQITVTFDPNICQHAAECVRGLPEVFDPKGRPWIKVDAAQADSIAEVIGRCPSGALQYTMAGETAPEEPASNAVEITVHANGPLTLSGKVRVTDAKGNVIKEADKCALCRCGASANKPFCDGSHKGIGFEAD